MDKIKTQCILIFDTIVDFCKKHQEKLLYVIITLLVILPFIIIGLIYATTSEIGSHQYVDKNDKFESRYITNTTDTIVNYPKPNSINTYEDKDTNNSINSSDTETQTDEDNN